MLAVARRWAPGAIPLLLVGVALAVLPAETLDQAAAAYRWGVYGLVAVLAWIFHRSRVFVAVFWIGALDSVVSEAPETDLLGAAGGILLLLLGLIALSRDRGVLSGTGMVQVLVGAVLAAVPALIFADSVNVEAFMALTVLPAVAVGWLGWPQPTLLLGGLGFIASAYAVFRWQGPVERGIVWAQLAVFIAAHPGVAPPTDSFFLVAAGAVLAVAIVENSYAMAYLDELTGLPARRALMRDLEGLGATYTLAMLDVDHFKKFNDRHGHDVGDQVLRLVAGRLAKAGAGGRAYRYGGEEFTLVFDGKERDETMGPLEVVRREVEAATFSLRSWNRPYKKPATPAKGAEGKARNLSVTISLGVAQSKAGDSPDAVLKRADQALYRAKKKGRNQISV